MRNLKRTLCAMLSGAMLLGLLCGCRAAESDGGNIATTYPGVSRRVPEDALVGPDVPAPEPAIDDVGPDVTFPQYALFHCDQPYVEPGPDAPEDLDDIGARGKYYEQKAAYAALLDSYRESADFETLLPRYLDFVQRAAPHAAYAQDGSEPNFAYSPLSLYAALCALSGTVSNDDRQSVLDFLGLDDADMAKSAAYAMYRGLSFRENTECLGLANSVWFREDLSEPPHMKNDAAEALCRDFFASAYAVPFGTEDADRAVSQWIDEKTDGVIHMDFKSSEDLAMAIVNALYYKDSWADGFSKSATDESDFASPGAGTVTVDMMHKSEDGDYVRTGDFTMSSIKADHGEVRFILPNDESADVKALMSDPDVVALACAASPYDKNALVHWSVPRFDVTSNLALTEALSSMGLDAIGRPLDMSELLDRDDIAVSSVIQQARVKADEDGFEAAAVTVIEMTCTMAEFEEDPLEIDMDLDRPFGFVIMSQDVPLFIGYVTNPTA